MNRPPLKQPKGEALEPFWSAVRGSKRKSSSTVHVMSTIDPLVEWTTSPSKTSLLVVHGSSPQDRCTLLQHYAEGEWQKFHGGVYLDTSQPGAWLEEGLLPNIRRRLSRVTVAPESKEYLPPGFPPMASVWELLWGLIAAKEFLVEEPLRGMVDQSFYLVHEGYRAIWEARFLAHEVPLDTVAGFVGTLLVWMSGGSLTEEDRGRLSDAGIKRTVNSEQERIDMLLLVLTLATQNGLIDRVVLVLDGLEEALKPKHRPMLKQLHTWISSIDRWVSIGNCPLGLVVGFSGSKSDLALLRRFNPKLFARVQRGLAEVP